MCRRAWRNYGVMGCLAFSSQCLLHSGSAFNGFDVPKAVSKHPPVEAHRLQILAAGHSVLAATPALRNLAPTEELKRRSVLRQRRGFAPELLPRKASRQLAC